MSVLPKNRKLVFSIRNYIWGMRAIFQILTSKDIADVIPLFSKHLYLCNKKKITRWFEDMKYYDMKYFFHSKINLISSRHRVVSFIHDD